MKVICHEMSCEVRNTSVTVIYSGASLRNTYVSRNIEQRMRSVAQSNSAVRLDPCSCLFTAPNVKVHQVLVSVYRRCMKRSSSRENVLSEVKIIVKLRNCAKKSQDYDHRFYEGSNVSVRCSMPPVDHREGFCVIVTLGVATL